MKQTTPHELRRQNIHSIFLIIVGIMLLVYAFGCSPKHGCYGTKGLSGYGWLKNKNTNKVFILDKEGAIVFTYYERLK